MKRIAAVAAALALVAALAGATSSGAASRAHPYSRRDVRQAFAAQGLKLSSMWLHVFVLRSPNANPTIFTIVGRPPKRICHACVVVRFPAPPKGAEPHLVQIQQGNVAVVYLAGHAVGHGVKAALAALGR